MSKIFVFSNSFATRTVLFGLDSLFNIKFDEVLLLKENHNQKEIFLFNTNIKIKLYESIDDCICLCDSIIMIKDDNIPEKSINYISCKSKELDKQCFEIINPWKNKLSSSTNNIDDKNIDFKKYPVILNISLGTISQSYCVEILLNKIFTKNSIGFKQFYSKEMENFLLQLDGYGILSSNFSRQIKFPEYQYNIIIYSINIGESIYNIKKYIDILRHIASDFTILQTDIKFNEYESAKNIIKYGCFSQLDMLIKSHYNVVDEKLTVYCAKKINEDSLVKDIESISLENKLSFNIFSKIAFPEGIVKL